MEQQERYQKAKQKILNQLRALSYPLNKELTREFEKGLEDTYTQALRTYFIAPKGIGEVVDGVARYNVKVSEVAKYEKQKDTMEFVGFTICQDELIEYYLKENTLYVFLYQYFMHDMTRMCVSLWITTKPRNEEQLDAKDIQ